MRIKSTTKGFEFVVWQVKFACCFFNNLSNIFIMNMTDVWENMVFDLVV